MSSVRAGSHPLPHSSTRAARSSHRTARATFERRRTTIALTPAFAEVDGKLAQWAGFIRRNRLTAAPADLRAVIDAIAGFIGPVLAAAANDESFAATWPPGGPWDAAL